MKYLSWRLDWSDPSSGKGPEEYARSLGIIVEPGPSIGDITTTGYIIGYGPDNIDVSNFSSWNMQELSQDDALADAFSKNETAYLNEDGKIGFTPPPVIIDPS